MTREEISEMLAAPGRQQVEQERTRILQEAVKQARTKRDKWEALMERRAGKLPKYDRKFATLKRQSTYEILATDIATRTFECERSVPAPFTRKQMDEALDIVRSRSRTDKIIVNCALCYYNSIIFYSKFIQERWDAYRVEALSLEDLIKLYDSYKGTLRTLSYMLGHGMKINGVSKPLSEPFHIEFTSDTIAGIFDMGRLLSDLDKDPGTGLATGYIYPDDSIAIEMEGSGRLMERIKIQADKVKQRLTAFKAYLEAAKDIIVGYTPSILELLPLDMERLINDIDQVPPSSLKGFQAETGEELVPEYGDIATNGAFYEAGRVTFLEILRKTGIQIEYLGILNQIKDYGKSK